MGKKYSVKLVKILDRIFGIWQKPLIKKNCAIQIEPIPLHISLNILFSLSQKSSASFHFILNKIKFLNKIHQISKCILQCLFNIPD